MKQLQLHVPVSNPRRRPLSSRSGQSPNFVARSEGFQSKDYRARGGKLLYECTEAAARKRSGLATPRFSQEYNSEQYWILMKLMKLIRLYNFSKRAILLMDEFDEVE